MGTHPKWNSQSYSDMMKKNLTNLLDEENWLLQLRRKYMKFVIYLILTEFRQPIQVQSYLEMLGILVQLGRIQCT